MPCVPTPFSGTPPRYRNLDLNLECVTSVAGKVTVPKGILEGEKFFFICGNFYFWKCFIYSNFLTVTVKMIVIETNIFVLIFLFWKRNIFLTVECRLPHPTFKIFSLLFCSVLEIFRLWCGNLL